jgi:hypothetical protein
MHSHDQGQHPSFSSRETSVNTKARILIRKLLHSFILLGFFCSGLGVSPVVHAQTATSPNANQSVTAAFNLSISSVFVVDVLTTDSAGVNPSQGIAQYLPSGDLQAASIKTDFYSGDPIQLLMEVNNQLGTPQQAAFELTVLDSEGNGVHAFEAHSTPLIPPGVSYWALSTLIPLTTPSGDYTFYGNVTFGENLTSDSASFQIIEPPNQIYLPMVRRQ